MADRKKKGTVAHVDAFFRGSRLSANPDRVLIADGELIKTCRKKAKAKQFFLFNDILVYGGIVVANKSYDKQCIISLEHVSIENLTDAAESKNGWLIKTKSKSFAVFASSEAEKDLWIKYIQHSVHKLLVKENKRSLVNYVPVWTPDNQEDNCTLCEIRFTFISRRHDCCKCGIVVCNKCSKNRLTLPSSNGAAVRACESCYVVQQNVEPAIVKAIQGTEISSKTSIMKDIATKKTTSAAAALASLRPWTATFYPASEVSKEHSAETGHDNEKKANAQLEKMLYDLLVDSKTVTTMPTSNSNEKVKLNQLTSEMEKAFAKSDSPVSTQIQELKKYILAKKGDSCDMKITADDLIAHPKEVEKISMSFGRKLLSEHGVHMIHHVIHILIMILFKVL